LAITLVLVYVGAVMVLFLFVVMMLDLNVDPVREGFIKYLPVGAAVALIIVIEMGLVVSSSYFGPDQYSLTFHAADYSNTKELGSVLYTFYVYPFEIASVILLVAIIAAISLTMRRREGVKSQDPGQQVRVSRDDRVRVVRMAPEKKLALKSIFQDNKD
jgi:NADH-quinone oxidoreductase subunit J